MSPQPQITKAKQTQTIKAKRAHRQRVCKGRPIGSARKMAERERLGEIDEWFVENMGLDYLTFRK